MARTKFTPYKYELPVYYAYYDENNGDLLEVSNEYRNEYASGIEITYEDFELFVSGKQKFKDYSVGYRTANNKTVLSIVPKTEQGYAFKNNILVWIDEPHENETEMMVEWDTQNMNWKFRVSETYKNKTLTNLIPSNFIFFITLKDDLDFLIRTITLETEMLLSNVIEIPFISSFENDISKISISSKLYFESYGLKINE